METGDSSTDPTGPSSFRGRVTVAFRLRSLLAFAVCAGLLACTQSSEEARAPEPTCEEGNAAACNELGIQLLRGPQVSGDWRRAAELFELACDGGAPEGCVRLGWMLLHSAPEGGGLRVDSAAATDLFERACDHGEALGCVRLGELYLEEDSLVSDVEPTGPLQDLALAASLFEEACDEGEMSGCVRLGLLHRNRVIFEADPVLGLELITEACDTDSPLGCAHLGRAMETGEGVPQDLVRATALYRESCKVEEMMGCFFLGGLYERGVGVPQDHDRAVDLYEQACFGTIEGERGSPGVAESCFRAARLLASGASGEEGRHGYVSLYRRACEMGYAEACEHEG